MTDFSPSAQAVIDALQTTLPAYSLTDRTAGFMAAAALDALSNDWRINTELIDGVKYIRTATLDKIVTELETQP